MVEPETRCHFLKGRLQLATTLVGRLPPSRKTSRFLRLSRSFPREVNQVWHSSCSRDSSITSFSPLSSYRARIFFRSWMSSGRIVVISNSRESAQLQAGPRDNPRSCARLVYPGCTGSFFSFFLFPVGLPGSYLQRSALVRVPSAGFLGSHRCHQM